MKTILILAGLLLSCLLRAESPAFEPPAQIPLTRYQPLWNKSPFTLESADTSAQSAAQHLFLVGLVKSGETCIVTIYNKQTQERTVLSPGQNKAGMELISVTDTDQIKQASAKIRRGQETATVRYDTSVVSGGAGAPGSPQQAQSVMHPSAPRMPAQPQPLQPPPTPSATEDRTRVVQRRRIIPSKPSQP